MKLKKLIPELVAGIKDAGYDKEPKPIQSLSIPKIKSGADLFIIAPDGAGKTTALVIGIIQQLKSPFEDVPRAIIITETKEKAFETEALFEMLGKRTKLRTFCAFDQGILQYQKDMIYAGVDIVIGTPKRLMELMNVMGLPLMGVKMLAFDDTDSISLNNYGKHIYRIADAIDNAQFLIAANKWNDNFDRISERIMKGALIVESN